MDGRTSMKEHDLDCCFYAGPPTQGLDCFPLYEDPYYLVVSRNCELADLEEVSVAEIAGKYPFIPTNESVDSGSVIWTVAQPLAQQGLMEYVAPENRATVAMVEMGLGVTILPSLDLIDLSINRAVKAIPLKGVLRRTISLLCPPAEERPPLTDDFLHITQQVVAAWKEKLLLPSLNLDL